MSWPLVRLLLRLAALATLAGAAAAIGFGYLGHVHAAFDSFSHFRIHLAAGVAAMALPLLLLRFVPEAALAALLGTGVIAGTLYLPSGDALVAPAEAGVREGPVFRLVHLNLRYDNREPAEVLSMIGRERPDVVTLVEVSEHWRPWLDRIAAAYPHRLVCPEPSRVGAAAILSRRPFLGDGDCHDGGAMATAALDVAGRRLDVAALHLGWPWPFSQPWQTYRMMPVLEAMAAEESVLLAADLNAVPWSNTARQLAGAGGLDIVRGIGPTWLTPRLPSALRPLVGLPIDNVMRRGAVDILAVRRLEAVGSDHLPLLVEFAFQPEPLPEEIEQAVAGLGW